jgi:hypothetical protein
LLVLLISLVVEVLGKDLNWNEFTMDQKKVISKAYTYGLHHNMQWSLVAIAIKESQAGKYLLGDGDYGVFQINLYYHLKEININSTYYTRSEYASKLISDFDYCAFYAIKKLQDSRKVYGNNWFMVWASYNGKGIKAREYAKDIVSIISQMKQYKEEIELFYSLNK